MKITVRQSTYKIDHDQYGGKIIVRLVMGDHQITREFIYGDPRYDDYSSRREAEQAATTFCLGAREILQLLKLHLVLEHDGSKHLIKKGS